MIVIAYRQGDYKSTVKYSDELIDRYPDGESAAAAHFWLAKALSKLGRDIEASEELTFLTGHFQRTYYGIRALEILGADMKNISRLVFWTAADEGKGVKGGPGPDRLEEARELLRTNIFDLALDEFAMIPKGIMPDANFAEIQSAYSAGDLYTSYKRTREFFYHGYCNLLNVIELADMLEMGFPKAYEDEISAVANRYKLDPSMLNGLILQESTFRADAVSPSDAIGLMQILPSTGTFIAHLKGLKTFDSKILYDTESNLDYGAFYFKYLLGEFDNNLTMVLAAYNGGPGNARTWRARYYNGDMDLFIEAIPLEETRDFIRYVHTNIRIYQAKALRESG
jgi:soluble lytic murein transglycosylase